MIKTAIAILAAGSLVACTSSSKVEDKEKEALKDIFSKEKRSEDNLDYTLKLIKKYNIIKECYQKAQHYINLASNSLSLFNDCEEKNILENLTSFSLTRNF